MMGTASGLISTLIVLDFDHTMIGVNSDTYVLKLSSREPLLMKELSIAGNNSCWTAGMDAAMGSLHKEGISIDNIKERMEEIKIDDGIKSFVSEAAGGGADVRVLSDANTLFIDWILQANGLSSSVRQVLSNPAVVEDGALRVYPFHKDPHPSTSTSPPNLCKGRVMEAWLSESQWSHVVYCGDGGGDFEGSLRVPKGGRILAREGWQLHQRLQKAQSEGRHTMADIVTWVDQSDLGIKLRNFCFPS